MAMLRRIWSLAVSLVLAFSGLTVFAQNVTVTRTVTYLQRIALPPNAVIKVTLEDVSLADAPANILAEKEIPATATGAQSEPVAAPFEATHWTLTELAAKQVPAAAGRQAAYVQFASEGNRVSGSTGCNRLSGAYEKNGSSLKFHPLATTMMACAAPLMEQENKFNDALNKTTHYRIKGNTLVLLNEKTALARFKVHTEDQQNPNP
jgi:heat shock protein HslJ